MELGSSPRVRGTLEAARQELERIRFISACPSVPMMLRQSPTGSLPLRAEVETSHGYASYH